MKEPCMGRQIFWGKAGECGKILITLQIKTFGPLPLLAFSRIRLFAGACAFGLLPHLWLGWLCWGLEMSFF